ncbi:MAG: PP2C family protein-serine/threonine phosphatase, partial [Acidobacteriota bacterium]|nr:PP2C family protein-serine/threonine phosphatase [Acidobacteriota bacterium]
MHPKYIWLRLAVVLGLGLGLLLLVQTILTYQHVTHGMLRQEAQRQIDLRIQSIGRSARLMGARGASGLTPVLHELVHESPQQIAWIRILNSQGKVLAESEETGWAPKYESGTLGRGGNGRGPRTAEKLTLSGPVMISVSPLRLGPPPFVRPPNDPANRIEQPSQTGPVPPAAPGVSPGVPAGNAPEPAAAPAPAAGAANRAPDQRAQRPPGPRGPRPTQEFVETAVYLNGISGNFGLLREYLVVGCLAACALMAAVIVIALRFPNYMRGKRVEEELALARRVQLDLFPEGTTLAVGLPFAAKCVPAWQVGGDLYDVFETDDGEVALILGDVSGKGLPAALLMGVVQGAVRASTGFGAAENHDHAAERLNQLLCMKTARERFVSLFWCYFDPRKSVLRYINAGHLPPLLVRQRPSDRPEVIRLDEGGPVLGLLPGARYSEAALEVQSGDILIVYSDGILEAQNAGGDEFGEERVIAAVARCLNQTPDEICAAVLEDVKRFLGPTPPHD